MAERELRQQPLASSMVDDIADERDLAESILRTVFGCRESADSESGWQRPVWSCQRCGIGDPCGCKGQERAWLSIHLTPQPEPQPESGKEK